MTDQEKREKVIKGLECCIALQKYPDEFDSGCFECPYRPIEKGTCLRLDYLLSDALALLKAQEPRVMTLEDVLKLRFNDVVYFEMAISGVAIPAIVIDVIEHMPDGEIGLLQLRHIQQPTNNADLEYYGKTWRCWTDKPTEEQRRETLWDSQG